MQCAQVHYLLTPHEPYRFDAPPFPWRLTVGREEREDGAGVMRRDDALYGPVQTANYSTALYR